MAVSVNADQKTILAIRFSVISHFQLLLQRQHKIYYFISFYEYLFHLVSMIRRARSLVLSDLRSETKGSQLESGC